MRLVFDRGTLLLEGWPEGPAPDGVPGVLWDPRVQRWRAPAHRRGEVALALERLGVQVAGASAPPAAFPAVAAPPLRPYQASARLAWQLAGHRGTVVLPTGSGKTRLAMAAIADLRTPTLCLVPTRVLLHQWHAELARICAAPVGMLGDGVRDPQDLTVATFESALRHADRLGHRFGLVVIDEVHHLGETLHAETLEMLVAPCRLGLTATPSREPHALERLAMLVGPIVFELAISDLAGGAFLAPFETVTMHLELAPDERAGYERDALLFRSALSRFFRAAPGAAFADFVRAAARSAEGRAALRAGQRAQRLLAFPSAKRSALAELLARHRDARALVFTADNETAYAIAREHLVMPLTCDIGRKERDLALAAFREGRLRTLVSARVLNEGLDVPDADVAIVVAGSLGEREHVQRVGRLLRPREGKRALVYELVMRGTTDVERARKRRKGLAARAPRPL